MWPTDDSTTNSGPRRPAMVRALAGDSTITRGRPAPLDRPWLALLGGGIVVVSVEAEGVSCQQWQLTPSFPARKYARIPPPPCVRGCLGAGPPGVRSGPVQL